MMTNSCSSVMRFIEAIRYPARWVLTGLTLLALSQPAMAAFSLVLTNGYGDCYRMNLLRNRDNYQAYRGICSYRGFSLSGCSTTGEVVMLRIKATPSMPEHSSILSTSMRWGTTMYILNDLFHPLCSWVSAGYENWYPFDMSCSVAMYINSGGYSARRPLIQDRITEALLPEAFSQIEREDLCDLFSAPPPAAPKAFSLVMTNGYGDCYRMNLLRNRDNYQAYRGICSYRGFSLSGCSTTGEVVMLRIKATPSMPEHFSLVSTSKRWGTTMYFLNDVFRPLCSWVSAGYENWYPFDMSCSVAMYINSGGYGINGFGPTRPEPIKAVRSSSPFGPTNGTNIIGVLLPLTGDLADVGQSYQVALDLALQAITNVPGMPPIRLQIEDTRTDAATAYNKLVELRSNGVHIVLGPETSEECRILKIFANENDVLLLSSSATAIPLALSGDNLMRLTIDDSHQAQVIANQLKADGITDISILARSDMYGEGMMTALVEDFQALGGTVFATNYCPRATEFIPEVVSNLDTQVSNRIAYKGINRVALITILFDEGVNVLENTESYAALRNVRWYGTDGMAQNSSLLTNTAAAACAAQTRYVCSAFGRFTNALYDTVEAEISAQLNSRVVPRYPMSSYDALWLVSLALQQTGGTQTMDQLIAAIRSIAATYAGCTGPINFNSAGDRSEGSYDLYEFMNEGGSNQWVIFTDRIPLAPGNVAASPGTYADVIQVAWNPVSSATSYELWAGITNDASQAILVAQPTDTTYTVTTAPLNTHCFFWVKSVNSHGTSALSTAAEGWSELPGALDIRINRMKGSVTLASPDTVSVTVQMDPGAYEGMQADWWVVANTPAGWYCRDAAGNWQTQFTPVYQGPLASIQSTEVLNINANALAAGTYVFYFGVDDRDGILDPSTIWSQSVTLTVLP